MSISAAAASAREQNRQADGKFGQSAHGTQDDHLTSDAAALEGKLKSVRSGDEITDADLDYMLENWPGGPAERASDLDWQYDSSEEGVWTDTVMQSAATAFHDWHPLEDHTLLYDGGDDTEIRGLTVTTQVEDGLNYAGDQIGTEDLDAGDGVTVRSAARGALRRLTSNAIRHRVLLGRQTPDGTFTADELQASVVEAECDREETWISASVTFRPEMTGEDTGQLRTPSGMIGFKAGEPGAAGNRHVQIDGFDQERNLHDVAYGVLEQRDPFAGPFDLPDYDEAPTYHLNKDGNLVVDMGHSIREQRDWREAMAVDQAYSAEERF